MRIAELILFCSRYDFKLFTASAVTSNIHASSKWKCSRRWAGKKGLWDENKVDRGASQPPMRCKLSQKEKLVIIPDMGGKEKQERGLLAENTSAATKRSCFALASRPSHSGIVADFPPPYCMPPGRRD
jgi:hypothetical protein